MPKPCYDAPHRPHYSLPTYEETKNRPAIEYKDGTAEQLKAIEENYRNSVKVDDNQDTLIEVIELPEFPATGIHHPLAPLAGKYADEPLWDDFMAAIEDYRRKQNELEDIAE